eukprot:COSAG06_NODE_29349_length_558_cov_0.904139_1_plen_153_part_01
MFVRRVWDGRLWETSRSAVHGLLAVVLLVLMIVLMLSAPAEATALGVNSSVSSPFANATAILGPRRTQEESAGFAGPGCELAVQAVESQYCIGQGYDSAYCYGQYIEDYIDIEYMQSQNAGTISECRDYWDGLCAEVVVIPEGVTEIPLGAFY